MYKLLLLEDEFEIGSNLEMVLKMEGYEVDWFTSGEEAVNAALNSKYHLMILDITLKKTSTSINSAFTNGVEVARFVSKYNDTPYIFLTSRSDSTDIMQGLDSGAEDYITKPYDLTVLLARIRTCLRRVKTIQEQAPSSVLEFDGIQIDLYTHKVKVDGCPVQLSNQLFDLLHYFMSNQNRIISKEELYKNIWNFDPSSCQLTNTLEVNIKRLRQQIGSDYIKTVRGRGYVLEAKYR